MQLQLSIQPWICALGTHYCWVAGNNVDSKLAQGFYTWLLLRESNPRTLDIKSNALTAQHMLHIQKKMNGCGINPSIGLSL